MLQQILVKTPAWVWVLLAFLIYRGLVASVDRVVGLRKVFIIPLVMLALSVQGIASAFGGNAIAVPVWLMAMMAGAFAGWHLLGAEDVVPLPERGSVRLRGSWSTMVLILGIFLTKYTVNVALSLQPDLPHQLAFVATVCALYGVFNGVFIGQLLRIVAIFRDGVARFQNFL